MRIRAFRECIKSHVVFKTFVDVKPNKGKKNYIRRVRQHYNIIIIIDVYVDITLRSAACKDNILYTIELQ